MTDIIRIILVNIAVACVIFILINRLIINKQDKFKVNIHVYALPEYEYSPNKSPTWYWSATVYGYGKYYGENLTGRNDPEGHATAEEAEQAARDFVPELIDKVKANFEAKTKNKQLIKYVVSD